MDKITHSLQQIFDTVGASTSEESDEAVIKAIEELKFPVGQKLKSLCLMYRQIERDKFWAQKSVQNIRRELQTLKGKNP